MKQPTSNPWTLDADLPLPGASTKVSSRRRNIAELAIGYGLILIVIWTPRPWQRLIYLVAAAFIATVLWNASAGAQRMGLRIANLARSFWLVGVAVLAAAASVFIAAQIHTLHMPGGPHMFVNRFWGYILFAFVQQFLLQDFFLPRLLPLMRGPGSAAIAAAALFSLAHLPNPILTVITFFWGLAACLFFLHYRNLYPLAMAHAILGITVAISVPGPVIRNMRVGLGYLTYPAHHRLNATRSTTPYPHMRG